MLIASVGLQRLIELKYAIMETYKFILINLLYTVK